MAEENSKRVRFSIWLKAARPRTLILAVASSLMGIFLAAAGSAFDPLVAFLTLLTAGLLQILSNLANDYGDSVHGADHSQRLGPARAVQSGSISARAMRRAIVLTAAASILCGIGLLLVALGTDALYVLVIFLVLGSLAVLAAITYTAGNLPYGYAGLGDIAVFVFFGWMAVVGSYFLQAGSWQNAVILPATSCGLFAVGVLNVNNIRDIDSDQRAGKRSIPVRLGLKRARYYHWALLIGGLLCALIYTLVAFRSPWQFFFLISAPLLLRNGYAVSTLPPARLDRFLGQMSLATLLFVTTFGMGLLLSAA